MSKKDDLEFEIKFCEGLIAKKPDFIEALILLGDLYTRKGMFKEGMEVDEKLIQLRPTDPIIFYNLACSYSLLLEIDKALRSIKRAINCGYTDFEHLEHDQDLENLRRDERFKRYFARIRNKRNLSPESQLKFGKSS
jgi:tetratricopeptide (TPR) repeat protein